MNRSLWLAQALLALAFLMAGSMKLLTAHEALAVDMTWVTHVPAAVVKLIGLLEVLGAIGLILPSWLRVKPWLTPLAAVGLTLTMIGAAATHLSIGEANMIAPNLVLGLIAGFIAWGRYQRSPIEAK